MSLDTNGLELGCLAGCGGRTEKNMELRFFSIIASCCYDIPKEDDISRTHHDL